MINSLLDDKMSKKFDSLASKQAKLDTKKRDAVKSFMETTNRQTIKEVFDTVRQNGHPNELKLSEIIEEKYSKGEELEFEDVMALNDLYKSNYEAFANKDIENE